MTSSALNTSDSIKATYLLLFYLLEFFLLLDLTLSLGDLIIELFGNFPLLLSTLKDLLDHLAPLHLDLFLILLVLAHY